MPRLLTCEETSGRTYANQRRARPEPHADRLGRDSSVRSCVRRRPLGARSLVDAGSLFTHGSALKDASTQCGREDSNLQPVSRPDPKFDGGPSGQSGAVRLVPVCAVQSGNGTSNRPTWRAFELSCAAGSVRSFVRSVGRQPHPPATIKTTTAAAELKHLAV
jgi:hypothetical protein